MQSLKCWVAVGVMARVISVRGDDTDAQTKAREALEKKLNELQSQPATQPTPAKPVAQPPPAKPSSAKQAPSSSVPAPAVPPSTFNAPPAADAAAIEKARAAMREKMNTPVATEVPPPATAPKITVQPPAEPAPAAAPAPPPVATPPPATPPPVVAAPAAAAAASVVSSPTPPPPAMPDLPPQSDPEAIAKAREALRQKMNELQAGQPAAPPQPPPAPPVPAAPAAPAVPAAQAPTASAAAVQPPSTPDLTAPPEADPAAIAKAREAMRLKMQTLGPETEMVSTYSHKGTQVGMNFPPLAAPPLGISAAKEQRLQELLQQYQADLISPEQYQTSRAKILAEP